jgi:FOG: WD40 repeat
LGEQSVCSYRLCLEVNKRTMSIVIYLYRTACYSEKELETDKPEEMQKIALERYNKAKGNMDERLVSCSDDQTLYMWDPVKTSKPVVRMTGHQQPVIHVYFLTID